MSVIKQNIYAMLISMVTTIVVNRREKLLQHAENNDANLTTGASTGQ